MPPQSSGRANREEGFLSVVCTVTRAVTPRNPPLPQGGAGAGDHPSSRAEPARTVPKFGMNRRRTGRPPAKSTEEIAYGTPGRLGRLADDVGRLRPCHRGDELAPAVHSPLPWSRRAGGAAEDLPPVPPDVLAVDRGQAPLRLQRPPSREVEDQAPGRRRAGDVLARHRDAAVIGQADDTPIEEPVVQRAQADAVAQVVGAAERPPPHVRGVQPDRDTVQPAVVTAEGAAELVRLQHL